MSTLLSLMLLAIPCDQLGVSMQQAWAAGEDPVSARFDMDVVLQRALRDFTRDSTFARGFRQGAGPGSLGKSLRQALTNQSGVAYFIGCRKRDRFPTAVFSVRYKSGAFSHFEFELRPTRGGDLKIIDVWTSYEGEWMSENTRRMALLLAPSAEPGSAIRSALFDEELITDADIANWQAFNAAATTSKPDETERLYQLLPKGLRGDRSVMGLWVSGVASSPELSTQAVEAYIAKFPDDPSVAFKAFDYHFTRGHFDDCDRALDTIDKAVSGLDPWITILRARVALAAKHLPRAAELADKAIELEPWNVEAFFTALDVAVAKKNHSATASYLDAAVRAGANYTRESLSAAPIFEAFMASPQGKRWQPPVVE